VSRTKLIDEHQSAVERITSQLKDWEASLPIPGMEKLRNDAILQLRIERLRLTEDVEVIKRSR
jgi:hypothetical protein